MTTLTATSVANLLGTKGATGLNTRSGSGAPTSSTTAVDGEPYVDTANAVAYPARAGGTFAAGQGLVGGPGLQGQAAGSIALPGAYHLQQNASGYSSSVSLSGSFQPMYYPGNSSAYQQIYAYLPGYLQRVTVQILSASSLNATFVCLDQTNNLTVWTSPTTYTATGTYDIIISPLSAPFIAPAKLAFGCTGSGSLTCLLVAQVAMCQGASLAVRSVATAAYDTVNAAANVQRMFIAGTSLPHAVANPTTAVLYNATLINTGASAVTFSLTNGSTTIVRQSVAAASETTLGAQSYASSSRVMDAISTWYWAVTGSVTAPCYALSQVVI